MPNRTFWKLGLTVLGLLLAAGIFVPTPAQADNFLSLSLQLPTSVSAGGTGTFDVVLSDAAGGTGVTIGGFDFDVEVTSTSGVTLTGAEPTSTGYIFSGNSFDETSGVPLNITPTPTTDLTASDLAADITSTGYTLEGGGSIDLGEVLFDVSPTAPTEMANVQFVSGIFNTDLSDPSGANIPINTETGGTIDIIGTAVPEPPTLIMLLGAIPFALLFGLRTRHKFEG